MKGDKNTYQDQISKDRTNLQHQTGYLQNNLNQQYHDFYNNYNKMFNQNQQDYGDIMGSYRNFGDQARNINLNPADRASLEGTLGKYRGFSETGGFSPQDIQDIRARSIAPTRGIYSRGMEQVNRANTLAGGNLASTPAALQRMQREQGQSIQDANVGANANIAQMRQQGRLAGLAGESGVGSQLMNSQLSADALRNQMMLSGISGQAGLYGTAPGWSSVLGNQMLGSSGQNIDAQNLMNQLMLGLQRNQLGGSQLPSNTSNFLNNAGGFMGLFGQVGRFLLPFLKSGVAGGGTGNPENTGVDNWWWQYPMGGGGDPRFE